MCAAPGGLNTALAPMATHFRHRTRVCAAGRPRVAKMPTELTLARGRPAAQVRCATQEGGCPPCQCSVEGARSSEHARGSHSMSSTQCDSAEDVGHALQVAPSSDTVPVLNRHGKGRASTYACAIPPDGCKQSDEQAGLTRSHWWAASCS